MSEHPFDKMDALLKKHRGGFEADPAAAHAAVDGAAAAPPPRAWLPVLTDVIERGTPPAPAPLPAEAASPPPAPVAKASPPALPVSEPPPAALVSDTLTEELMSELAPRLSEVMEKKVAAELRKNLDQTVSTLLAQLDVNVREIVREAVAEKLRHPRDPSA